MDDLTTLLMINQGQTDPKRVAEAKGLIFTEDLGILDPEIVAELVTKMSSYSEKSVWEALQMPLQTEGENQIKIAYQLVRDHKRILKGSESTRDN
jgi:carbon catabolite-derepressing protein kinase